MQASSPASGKEAAALATWIVIQAVERNPVYFADQGVIAAVTDCLDSSFACAEQGRYHDALSVLKCFLGKVSLEAPKIFAHDPELFDAVARLAQIDQAQRQ